MNALALDLLYDAVVGPRCVAEAAVPEFLDLAAMALQYFRKASDVVDVRMGGTDETQGGRTQLAQKVQALVTVVAIDDSEGSAASVLGKLGKLEDDGVPIAHVENVDNEITGGGSQRSGLRELGLPERRSGSHCGCYPERFFFSALSIA